LWRRIAGEAHEEIENEPQKLNKSVERTVGFDTAVVGQVIAPYRETNAGKIPRTEFLLRLACSRFCRVNFQNPDCFSRDFSLAGRSAVTSLRGPFYARLLFSFCCDAQIACPHDRDLVPGVAAARRLDAAICQRMRDVPIWLVGSGSDPPKTFEPGRGQLRVAHRVLDVLVPEIGLKGAGVVPLGGQRKSTGMAQHVRVRFEA
jgi:hypothetical protein